jgi:hypothetical protein
VAALLAHGALQLRVFHAPAQYVDQIQVLAEKSPARADAETAAVIEFIPILRRW